MKVTIIEADGAKCCNFCNRREPGSRFEIKSEDKYPEHSAQVCSSCALEFIESVTSIMQPLINIILKTMKSALLGLIRETNDESK